MKQNIRNFVDKKEGTISRQVKLAQIQEKSQDVVVLFAGDAWQDVIGKLKDPSIVIVIGNSALHEEIELNGVFGEAGCKFSVITKSASDGKNLSYFSNNAFIFR